MRIISYRLWFDEESQLTSPKVNVSSTLIVVFRIVLFLSDSSKCVIPLQFAKTGFRDESIHVVVIHKQQKWKKGKRAETFLIILWNSFSCVAVSINNVFKKRDGPSKECREKNRRERRDHISTSDDYLIEQKLFYLLMNALGANMRDKIYELDKVDCFLLFVKYLICYHHYYYSTYESF